MSEPRLPARLRGLLDLVPTAVAAVADIGAGHGALSAHLLQRSRRVVATEVAPGPLREVRRNLSAWGVLPPVETRLGWGLQPLEHGEFEAAIVAGVGAHTLLAIAADAVEKAVPVLVLQCVQRPHLVEPWLAARGWRVMRRDDLADRGRVYPTWLVEVVP